VIVAKVIIGGKERVLPELNVRRMRFVLPRVQKMQTLALAARGEGRSVDAGEADDILRLTCEALGAWLEPPPLWEPGTEADACGPTPCTPETANRHIARKAVELEESLSALESTGLGPAINQAMEENGMAETGESEDPAPELAAVSPSISSSTQSSASSSQPGSAADPGTP
jgi:hypothetical protein